MGGMPSSPTQRLDSLLASMETLAEQVEVLAVESRWSEVGDLLERMRVVGEAIAELSVVLSAQKALTAEQKAKARKILDRQERSVKRLEEAGAQMGEKLAELEKSRSRVSQVKPVYGKSPYGGARVRGASGLDAQG